MKLRIVAITLVLFFVTTLAYSQSWIPLVNQPNDTLGLGNPLLLTDGTVILHQACGPQWYKLTPDQFGDFQRADPYSAWRSGPPHSGTSRPHSRDHRTG